jgi:hypothetical protein
METKTDIQIFTRKTDTNYTKKVKGFGTPDFTNIDTYYLIQEATKEFGLFGKGWGIKNVEWEHITLGATTIAKLEATFFIPSGEFQITNSDKLAYTTSKGKEMIDTDVYKKIETNTIAKALSRLGFGTDIYLGKFEDNNYTNEIMNEVQLCNPDTMQHLRGLLQQHDISADIVTKHFNIRALTELQYKYFNQAVALIEANSKTNKGK